MTRPRGRPRLADEPATVHVKVRMTPTQRLELERIAADNHMRMTTFMREAINEAVSDCREQRPVFSRSRRGRQ